MSAHNDGHGEHAHRPVWHYLLIAAILTLITGFEIGPLFKLYALPGELLIALSIVKFAIVVALFMHLYDDSRIFTSIFVPALMGSIAMVIVLMVLFWGWMPSPHKDAIPMQERYWVNYSGQCNAWIRSATSNRWYCSSPAIDADRMLAYTAPAQSAAAGCASGLKLDLTGKADDAVKAELMTAGEKLYGTNCAMCHQATGLGVPGAFPPLAASDYITDAKVHVDTMLKGRTGALVVNGVTYNGAMPAQVALCDDELAAIATYERNAWGNALGVILPKDFASAR